MWIVNVNSTQFGHAQDHDQNMTSMIEIKIARLCKFAWKVKLMMTTPQWKTAINYCNKFETVLIGGLPEEGEADSLHILNEYGVKPILIPELKRNPNFFSDRNR